MVRAWTRFRDASVRSWRADGPSAELVPTPKVRADSDRDEPPRVLFVNQYYWPSHASTAQHLTDLAESLAARGIEVHVLCSKVGPGHGSAPAREERNGVTIHRVAATGFGRRRTIGRMVDYLSFYAYAVLLALRLPRFDVVATLTTPPIIGLVGTILRKVRGSRHVYWSMDLHPDASLALGRMSSRNPMVAALAWLSDTVYRQADRVIVLGQYMHDRVAAKGVRPSRLETIPVWSRADEIDPLPRDGHPLRRELGLDGKFVAMYSGNHGLAHCFDEFLEAARRFRANGRDDVVFLFVGDGPRRAEVERAKEAEGLDNVRLIDYVPRERLRESLSLADVHLISMRREMTGIVVPSKLYGAMASGRPALFVGPEHCEAADTIRRTDCGAAVRLGDADALVGALERLAADAELADAMGRRGRAAFLREHERAVCCDRWAEMLLGLVGESLPVRVALPA